MCRCMKMEHCRHIVSTRLSSRCLCGDSKEVLHSEPFQAEGYVDGWAACFFGLKPLAIWLHLGTTGSWHNSDSSRA